MKATKIIYKKLFNIGNYQHEEIGVEIEVEQNESAAYVLTQAKKLIEKFDPNNSLKKRIEDAKRIVDNPSNYIYGVVEETKILLKKLQNEWEDDLPF